MSNPLDTFHPIATVPCDGRPVCLTYDGVEVHIMRWNPEGRNALVQGSIKGIWEALDKSYTWSEVGGCGPTHWKHYQQ